MPKGYDVTEEQIRMAMELDRQGLTRSQIGKALGLCKATICNHLPRKRHGKHRSGAYGAWSRMRSRCNNPRNPSYARYGGRGIKVCERWKLFANFYADMGDRPEGTSLDRINNDGDYEPGNCRWATNEVQNRNKSTNRFLELGGQRKTISEWASLLGMSVPALSLRLSHGWPLDKALTLPPDRGRRLCRA